MTQDPSSSTIDLGCDVAGIRSPNPFWLASAPPTNSRDQIMRAFDYGWGGAVWKTLGDPIINVTSRLGGLHWNNHPLMGLNNIELITDRPLETNLREIREVKKRYPKHALIVSLMVESKREVWHDIVKRSQDTGADGLELNFGCPHGMSERGMGSAVGQVPEYACSDHRVGEGGRHHPCARQADAERGGHPLPGARGREGRRGRPVAHQHDQQPDGRRSANAQGDAERGRQVEPRRLLRPGRQADRAEHAEPDRAPTPQTAHMPISGIGGIGTWQDAAEFLLLGASGVQVCTAVMHYGYRIVEDMIEGLENYMRENGWRTLDDFKGKALTQVADWSNLDLNYKLIARIDPDTCIRCNLCHVACEDGAHQCISPAAPQEDGRVLAPVVDED